MTQIKLKFISMPKIKGECKIPENFWQNPNGLRTKGGGNTSPVSQQELAMFIFVYETKTY